MAALIMVSTFGANILLSGGRLFMQWQMVCFSDKQQS
jgi:hypothetical protein